MKRFHKKKNFSRMMASLSCTSFYFPIILCFQPSALRIEPRTLTSAQSEEGNTLPGHLPIPHPPPGVTNKAIEMSERESSRTNKAGSKEQQQQRGRSQNNGSQFSTQNMVEHKSASRVIRKRTRCRCCSFCWISNNKELILVMAVCLLISVLTTAPWQPF